MSGIVETTRGVANDLAVRSKGLLEEVFPTEKRAELYNRAHVFIVRHPRIATLLFFNILLTGLPLVAFITFGISVFVFTLLATLVLSILTTLFLTVLAVGFSLFFFLPVAFFTTLAATFVWVWSFAAFSVWRYFTDDKEYTRKSRALTRQQDEADAKERAAQQGDDAKSEASPGDGWVKAEGNSHRVKSESSPRHKQLAIDGSASKNGNHNAIAEKVMPPNPYELLDEGKGAMDSIPSVETQD